MVRWCWVNFQCRCVLLIWIIVGQGLLRLQWVRVGVVWTFLLSSIISLFFLPLFGRRLLVVLGLNGPLRQYFSLYRAVSQREGERGEKGKGRVKMSKPTPPAPTASAIGPCPTIIQTEILSQRAVKHNKTIASGAIHAHLPFFIWKRF